MTVTQGTNTVTWFARPLVFVNHSTDPQAVVMLGA